MSNKTYKDYFNIDPKYYAAVTADLIKSGQVKWTSFYPHDTFVKLLEKVHTMLSGKDPRSLWVEGAYGTGKSHAALTVKSLLEASDDEIRAYFKDYGLREDLCQQLITDKNGGKLITIHRIGSGSIHSDQDLILALQDSITKALQEHGIENRGEAALKEAALKWLEEKEANRNYFNDLIHEDRYMWEFGGQNVDQVIAALKDTEDEEAATKMMRKILSVAEDNGITALRMDVFALCDWIKGILDDNKDSVSGIVFVWDEFTEFFINNSSSLTGFQTLAEISESHPFYFLIVTHQSSALIRDKDMRRKILNRFVGDTTVRIEMPENMAFRLMAQAMKTTNDPVLLPEWQAYKEDLNSELTGVRNTIIQDAKKHATMGAKTVISDEELKAIVPMHPYAALLLKHMSVAFNSNARSMFDFIISNDMTEAKGFKWFINTYGPIDETYLLTIDMLWDFFMAHGQSDLNDDVRVILDAYSYLPENSLTPEMQRVFKTVLLLEAISTRVQNVDLLRPNSQNVDLAFNGTDWQKGKAGSIANALVQRGLLFEKPGDNGMVEYTAANRSGDSGKIKALQTEVQASIRTQDLIEASQMMASIQIPPALKQRYVTAGVSAVNFTAEANKLRNRYCPNQFKAIFTFALNDAEEAAANAAVQKAVAQSNDELFYIESLVPLGEDLLRQYVQDMAYSKYYAANDRARARNFEGNASKHLTDWKNRVMQGQFMIYTSSNRNGIRAANRDALIDELKKIDNQIYYCGLENYTLNDTMFAKTALSQAVECGITQELKGAFKSSNANTSLSTALTGAWNVDEYWKDPTKRSLPIVRIKQRVETIISAGFESESGRVSIMSIYEALEEAPYGFMPMNVTAFVMGFILKEYANADYFWSNGSNSDAMSLEYMKKAIPAVLNQKSNPSSRFKEDYIVAMSANLRGFLKCTAKVFRIPENQCGSVESARDQLRIKMKGLEFPIWCVKYILDTEQLQTPAAVVTEIIDAYCGIANTANGNNKTESDLADRIGALVRENPTVTAELARLLTSDKCRSGMLAYIAVYQNGELRKLATEINDGGAYIDRVKARFNADAANWVWNSATVDEKISDVILEYRIIAESNKSLSKCSSIRETVNGWNSRTNNIRIPFECLRSKVGELRLLLEPLYDIKRTGQIQEQYKSKFYNALVSQREHFEEFYRGQLAYFKQIEAVFLNGLSDEDIAEIFDSLSTGQFTKGSSEYEKLINDKVNEHLNNSKKRQLEEIWREKTDTKNPVEWSDKYSTPVLCMFSDDERSEARKMLGIVSGRSAQDADISTAIDYLKNGTFFDRLKDPDERDKCFMERVVGDEYAVILGSADEIRGYLRNKVFDKAYNWIDNSSVKNCLKGLAEQQYRLTGREKARAIIDQMGTDELRRYLNEQVNDNMMFGVQILKNK